MERYLSEGLVIAFIFAMVFLGYSILKFRLKSPTEDFEAYKLKQHIDSLNARIRELEHKLSLMTDDGK